MKVKRIKWNGDEPATEKQMAYVQALVAKRRQSASESVDKASVEVMFWNAVEIPSDLTKLEASGIIDALRSGDGYHWLPGHLESAIDALEAGKKITSATPGIMSASVFHDAINRILEMVP